MILFINIRSNNISAREALKKRLNRIKNDRRQCVAGLKNKNMKKRNFIGGTLAIVLCAIVLCTFAANENTNTSEAAVSEQQIPTTVSRTGGKVLVAYFSVPETDGVDASSGASRLVSDGKLQGNTEYVADHYQRSHRR